MNKKSTLFYNLITVVILVTVILLFETVSVFPWWGFVIPVIIVGMVITKLKWQVKSFTIGFLSGFLIWFGASFYFDSVFNGIVMSKVGSLLSINKIVVMILSGLVGGLVMGLALYTGKSITQSTIISELEEFVV